MKKFVSTYLAAALIIAATAVLSYSCNKSDDEAYTLQFASPALYFDFGDTQSVGVNMSKNVGKLTVSTKPDGWSVNYNQTTATLTVTAPKSLDATEDEDGNKVTPVETGTVVLRGSVGDKSVSASLYVALGEIVDLTSSANSYVLTQPSTAYSIPATRPDGSAVENIESTEVVWMTARYMIRYTEYKNGKITFSTNAENDELTEGNALIAACDKDGNRLWCWHLWVTDEDPEANAVELNGHTFMGCNLGAFGNETGNDGNILDAYGLYYQWGRPSPFPRPRYFDCADSSNQVMYNGTMSAATMKVEECDETNNLMMTAITDPLVFVTGLTAPWVGASEPWSDTQKTNYDPCPAGWRVPSSNVFDGLAIVAEEMQEEMTTLQKNYGWTLSDGSQSAFFFAGGRRSYLNGTVINMNTQETPQPWEGFYWTSSLDTSRQTATGLFFDLNTEDATQSRLLTGRSLQLSNGLQIRCVRE